MAKVRGKRYRDIRFLIFKVGTMSTGLFAQFEGLKTFHLVIKGQGLSCKREAEKTKNRTLIILPEGAIETDPICKVCLYNAYLKASKHIKLNI